MVDIAVTGTDGTEKIVTARVGTSLMESFAKTASMS